MRRAMESGWLTYGPLCQEFEAAFAAHVGASRAVALSSGTAALHLALVAQGIGAGDEVITTPLTFCSCAHVIEHVGATPVFADIDSVTMQVDPGQIERALGPRTKAIIAVDYGGHPCHIEDIVKMARERGITVIEDAAHSLGAAVGDRPVGSIADMTAFSFYATKNITTGDGGMLTTEDPSLAERVERLRMHGIQRDAWARYRQGGTWQYEVTEAGFKANMTDLQAALGLSQLRREAAMRGRRTTIATHYSTAFASLGDLVELPTVEEGVRSAWHLYPLRLAGDARSGRDQLAEAPAAARHRHERPLHAAAPLSTPARASRFPWWRVSSLRGRLFTGAVAAALLSDDRCGRGPGGARGDRADFRLCPLRMRWSLPPRYARVCPEAAASGVGTEPRSEQRRASSVSSTSGSRSGYSSSCFRCSS